MGLVEILKAILGGVLGAATGGATEAAGFTARAAAFVTLLGAVGASVATLWAHRADIAAAWNSPLVSFSVGQFVLGALFIGVFVYVVTLLAHRAPPPQ